MKQGGLFVAGLILAITMFCIPAYSDDVARNIISQVVDPFDDPNPDVTWTWTATGSKFITKQDDEGNAVTYPRVGYFEHVPLAIKNICNKDDVTYRVLGIEAKFDRQGNNWFDIFPIDSEGKPFEIPLRGIISSLDMWVWGSNFNYQLEVLIRDSYGIVHTLDMGNLNFSGWKNMYVNVPTSIPQLQRYLPRYRGMTLVAFRIRTNPTERVNGYRVFFDRLKIVTDMHESMFDGYELMDENVIKFEDSSTGANASASQSSNEGAN